jgi:hypothetical protein
MPSSILVSPFTITQRIRVDLHSADHHHLYEAEPHRLIRLRRENLVHLYHTAGLADDVEALTKSALVQAIVDAREDDITLPPSSPPGPSAASDCSSDDGNTAEDESPTRPSPRDILRRRATANQFASGSSPSKWNKSRSVSMGYLPSLEPLQASNSKQQLRRVGTSAGKRLVPPVSPPGTLPLTASLGAEPRCVQLTRALPCHRHPRPVGAAAARCPPNRLPLPPRQAEMARASMSGSRMSCQPRHLPILHARQRIAPTARTRT